MIDVGASPCWWPALPGAALSPCMSLTSSAVCCFWCQDSASRGTRPCIASGCAAVSTDWGCPFLQLLACSPALLTVQGVIRLCTPCAVLHNCPARFGWSRLTRIKADPQVCGCCAQPVAGYHCRQPEHGVWGFTLAMAGPQAFHA